MNEDYKKQIIRLVQQINEERYLRYLYILINKMATNKDNNEKE